MEPLNKDIVLKLFDLAQNDTPASVSRLAVELGSSRREVADALDELSREGLVRGDTVRLTFVGLMHAAGLSARRAARSTHAA